MSTLSTSTAASFSSEESAPSYALNGQRFVAYEEQSNSISQEAKSLFIDSVLDVLSSFSENGWDGEEAEAISPAVVAAAIDLIGQLPNGINRPEVSPGKDGEILFDWHGRLGELLTIACTSSGKYFYAAHLTPTSSFSGSEYIPNPLPFVLRDLLLKRFLSQ